MPRYIVPAEIAVEARDASTAQQFVMRALCLHVPHRLIDTPVVGWSVDTPELEDEGDSEYLEVTTHTTPQGTV